MPTRLLALLFPFVLLLGCTGSSTPVPVDLVDSADGKADAVSGKRIIPRFSGEELLLSFQTLSGQTEIVRISDEVLDVTSTLNVVWQNQFKTPWTVAVKSDSLIQQTTTNSGFTMYQSEGLRLNSSQPWTPVTCDDGARILNYASTVKIDHVRQRLTFGDAAYSFEQCGITDPDAMLGFFVLPLDGWFDLEGEYPYEISRQP